MAEVMVAGAWGPGGCVREYSGSREREQEVGQGYKTARPGEMVRGLVAQLDSLSCLLRTQSERAEMALGDCPLPSLCLLWRVHIPTTHTHKHTDNKHINKHKRTSRPVLRSPLPTSLKAFPSKSSATVQNSTTSQEPSAKTTEPLWDI